jgi:hypothetical protein
VDVADLGGEFGVGAFPLARALGQPPVVALPDDAELIAQERDRELLEAYSGK